MNIKQVVPFSYIAAILVLIAEYSEAINCYTCNSRNGTDPNCEDPYNPALSKYQLNCQEPKEGHIGRFPATFCVKLIGKIIRTGELFVIRRCALDNMDNQCGVFRFENDTLRGCILTCDYDGCNTAYSRHALDSRIFYATTLLYFAVTLSLKYVR